MTCYYPDGTVAGGDTACHSSSTSDGVSACCSSSHICLNNNLCLHTNGQEQISRGSCTDETWQSPECPQYCSDVTTGYGTGIYLVEVNGKSMFCCSNMNPFNSTCLVSTKGSSSPFFIEAGLVINNRTSGSTSPNTTDTATIIITSTATKASIVTSTVTATAISSGPPSICTTSSSPSSSSRREVTVTGAVSALLGLGLLVTLGSLWKQRNQRRSLRKDVLIWQEKYSELKKTKTVNLGGAGLQSHIHSDGWMPGELDGQAYLPAQLEGWTPGETEGTQIHEVANSTGRA